MSDLSDYIAEMDRDEEIRKIDDERYFHASKFQEMQKRLQLLKEENKRQMDIIMNNLDELMANKLVIDKALENAEEIEPIINDDNLSIVDLLAKVTGYVKDSEITNKVLMHEVTSNMSFMEESPEGNVALNDDEKSAERLELENVSELIPDIKDCEKESETEEISKNGDTQIKSQDESEKSDTKETESCDSTKLLEQLNIGSTENNSEDQILSNDAK